MSRGLAIGALLLLLGSASDVHADAVVTVCGKDSWPGDPRTDLTEALQVGGRITFACSGIIEFTKQQSLSKDLQIDGEGKITLDGKGHRLFGLGASGAHVSFSRISIQGGGLPPGSIPGSVVAGEGFVSFLDGTSVRNSDRPVWLLTGDVDVSNATFAENTGPVIIVSEGKLTISQGSRFTDNKGQLLATGPITRVTVEDSQFFRNGHSDFGGTTATDCEVIIRKSWFEGNADAGDGGALRTNCNTRIASSTFTGNQAKSGGAIHIGDLARHTTLIDVEFNGNIATGDGGGIAFAFEVLGPSHPPLALELHHVTFKGNRAGVGGALAFARGDVSGAVLNPRTLTGAAVQFIDNQASLFAGALFTSRAQVQLTRSLFTGNRAATAGGGLVGLQSGDGSVELSNSILVKNVAAVGAAFAGNGVTFINTTLADNAGPAVSAMASVASGLPIAGGPIGPQPIRFHNTIMSGGTGGPCGPADPAGPYQDLGNNLQYPVNSCAASIAVGAPQFGPSYIPLPSSPAAHAGNDAVCAAVPIAGRDIWDKTRPKGPHCAIGAAEADIQNIVEQALAPLIDRVSTVLRCFCGIQ
jgi:predicted outer membrane repeat protein